MFELLLQGRRLIVEGPFPLLMSCFQALLLFLQALTLRSGSIQLLLQLTGVLLVARLAKEHKQHWDPRLSASEEQLCLSSYLDALEVELHSLEAAFGLLVALLQLRLQALNLELQQVVGPAGHSGGRADLSAPLQLSHLRKTAVRPGRKTETGGADTWFRFTCGCCCSTL